MPLALILSPCTTQKSLALSPQETPVRCWRWYWVPSKLFFPCTEWILLPQPLFKGKCSSLWPSWWSPCYTWFIQPTFLFSEPKSGLRFLDGANDCWVKTKNNFPEVTWQTGLVSETMWLLKIWHPSQNAVVAVWLASFFKQVFGFALEFGKNFYQRHYL